MYVIVASKLPKGQNLTIWTNELFMKAYLEEKISLTRTLVTQLFR
jgi:hypothetical protein